LLHRLGADAHPTVGPPGNALGHWYANLVTVNKRPHVLALSERSLLSVVLPAAPFATLLTRFPAALEDLLLALSVPAKQISWELEATVPLVVAKTASRKVLGCLNQFVFALEVDVSYNQTHTLRQRELWLSQYVSSTIGFNHPRDLALELLATRGGQ
jgi:hypothetical protein